MTGAKPGIRWFLAFWLFILSAVAFLDRVNISVAGASIASAYHLTNVQLGTVFSALLWGYALFQTLGGRLADRFGPRRVLAMGVIWWGVFTALTAAVPGNIERPLILFVAVRFLLGAGEAVVYPASNQFVSRWIPSQERGIANGWIFAGVGAGAGLSPPLITFLMLHYGWRVVFCMRATWAFCRSRLVSLRARFSCRTPTRIGRRTGFHPLRPDDRGAQSQARPLDESFHQQRRSRRDSELFLLWVRRLDFLQLVLHLFGPSTWAQPEGQRSLRDASLSRDGCRLHDWIDQRSDHAFSWSALRTLHFR